MVWVAILFSLIDAVLAFFLVALGAHGGQGLQIQAPFVLIASVGTTWIAWALLRGGPRRMAWKWFLLVATAAAALAPAAGVATITYSIYQDRQQIRRIVVKEVRDEPILAPDGHPIGVRLRFQFMTPDGGYAFPRPEMWTADNGTYLSYAYEKAKIDGIANAPHSFEAERTYAMEFELKPNSGCCDSGRAPCTASRPPAPLVIRIGGTPFGMPEYGGREEKTRGLYDPAKMLQGVPPCP